MPITVHPWEWMALVAAVVGGVLGRLVRARLAAWWATRMPTTNSRVLRLASTWGPDAALLIGVYAVSLPALFSLWNQVSPYLSPMGPDADENFLAAVALERETWALYASDRYPAYAWLVARFASDALHVHEAGARLSMAFTLAGGLAAYATTRLIGGRIAAALATLLYFRLPGIVDAGRQFTPYMMIAALDLAGIALTLALLRGHRTGVPLAIVSGLLFAADPKQMPVALVFVGIGAVVAAWRRSPVGVIALLLAVPAANFAVGRLPVEILSVEAIANRVDLGLTAPAEPKEGGFRVGRSLRALPDTLARLSATEPRKPRAWLHDRVGTSIPMELPRTGLVWCIPAAIALLWWRRLPAFIPLLPLAFATLHLHFQHRYFAALVAPLPGLVVGGLAVAGGPGAALGASAVALLWPGSPWRAIALGILDPPPHNAEPWAGREPPDWTSSLAAAVERFPPGAIVVDYAQSRPWVMLAAGFPYFRCAHTRDGCRSVWERPPSVVVGVLYGGESLSVNAPRGRGIGEGPTEPLKVEPCWEQLLDRPAPGAAYLWTCGVKPPG